MGKRVRIRRGVLYSPSPTSPPTYEYSSDGLAVYYVRFDVTIDGYKFKAGGTVILPYTKKFFGNPNLLMLREMQ